MRTTGTWAGLVGLAAATFALGVSPLAAQAPSRATEAAAAGESAHEAGDEAAAVESLEAAVQPAVVEIEVGQAAHTATLLSKLPYVSRLFKNTGVIRVHAIKVEAKPGDKKTAGCTAHCTDNAPGPIQPRPIPPHAKVDSRGVIGIEFNVAGKEVAEKCEGVCLPHRSETVAAGKATGCAAGTCNAGSVCQAQGVCTAEAVCAPQGPCTNGACSSTSACAACSTGACSTCKTGQCACGEDCRRRQGVKIIAGPVQWFRAAGQTLRLPTVFDGQRIAVHAETIPAPHPSHGPVLPQPPVARPPVVAGHGPQAGCPFERLHHTLVGALTEKAALEARLEAREEMIEQVLTLASENAKLKATTELAGEVIKLKDEHARQQRELWEHVLEMEKEKLEALAEAAVERATLEAKLELAETRQELLSEQLSGQVEIVQQSAALQVQAASMAAGAEAREESVERLRAENEKLKAELAALHGEKAAARTAKLPSGGDESQE